MTAAQMQQYEDPQLQGRCLALIPVAELERRARLREPDASPQEDEEGLWREALFIELLRWFKSDFFTWVDKPACHFCGGPTSSAGVGASTQDEARWLANRTEIYACDLCGSVTRYPRYNHAEKLLETRRGRCGEWAQCFALCCRAMGYETRMVNDWTDHVWVEVYSRHLGRWAHADPCEAAYDKPLLYEAGWGKKLTYVVAVAKDEAVDVIHRYTRQWDQVLARRVLVSEAAFAQIVEAVDRQQRQRARLDGAQGEVLAQRREAEARELAQAQQREVSPEEAVGRTSGSQEWREARHEVGHSTGAAAAVAPPSTCTEEVFGYASFEQPEAASGRLSLVGAATVHAGSRAVLLTPAQNDRVGALWHAEAQSLASTEFFTTFRFQIQRNGGAGADGFAFVIQAVGPQAIGTGGCELGYGGLPQSLAIEFDTYESSDRCDDPSDNHISVHSCGLLPNSAHHRHSLGCTRRNLRQLADGRPHDVAIHYHDHRLDVLLDGSAVLSVAVGDLAARLGSDRAWLGFTAATGGLCQAHAIFSWALHRPPPAP